MRLTAALWPDQQAARGRPVGPAEDRVQRLTVGWRRQKVSEPLTYRMRQVEHQLAGRSIRRIARCRSGRENHRQGSADDARQRPDPSCGVDIGHGRSDYHEAGHDRQRPHPRLQARQDRELRQHGAAQRDLQEGGGLAEQQRLDLEAAGDHPQEQSPADD